MQPLATLAPYTPLSDALAARSITLTEIARVIRPGVSRSAIGRWANGSRRLPRGWETAISDALLKLGRRELSSAEEEAIRQDQVARFGAAPAPFRADPPAERLFPPRA